MSSSSSSTIIITWASQVCLFAMTLGLSATVSVAELRQCLQTQRPALVAGVILQYTVMPVAGVLAVWTVAQCQEEAASFTAPMAWTLLVLTSSPGGSYSTWWCAQMSVDVCLSVALTTVSSIVGIVLLPLNLYISTWLCQGVLTETHPASDNNDITTNDAPSTHVAMNLAALLISLAVVLLAIAAGLGLSYVCNNIPSFSTHMNRLGNAAGLCLVTIGLWSTQQSSSKAVADAGIVVDMDENKATAAFLSWPLYLAVALPCLLGLVIPTLIARRCLCLSKPETVAMAVECCYQNNGIATSVALAMCPPAVAVPLAYGAMEVVVLALYGAWARRAGWTMENNADGSIMDKPVEYALVGMSMVGLEMEEEDSHKDDSSMDDEEESGDALLPLQLSQITTQAKELAYERQETEETLDSSLA